MEGTVDDEIIIDTARMQEFPLVRFQGNAWRDPQNRRIIVAKGKNRPKHIRSVNAFALLRSIIEQPRPTNTERESDQTDR